MMNDNGNIFIIFYEFMIRYLLNYIFKIIQCILIYIFIIYILHHNNCRLNIIYFIIVFKQNFKNTFNISLKTILI